MRTGQTDPIERAIMWIAVFLVVVTFLVLAIPLWVGGGY